MESKSENLSQLVGNEMKQPDASQFHDLTFKSVLDALPCYLTIQDANLNILFVNQTFLNDFGNGIGKSCYKVFHGTEHKCSECPVQKTFADKQVHVAEEIILLKDDTVNQKNMLEGLEGGAYVVDEGLKDQDWELTTKGWQIVSKNVAEIYRVTQDVLYSSKKRTPNFQSVKPSDVAYQAVELFHEKASTLEIQFISQLNPSLPHTTMDSPSIVRMLSNLIWNALEACDKDDQKPSHSVIIRADYYDKNHFMFEIEDNAEGMDITTQENLFKEFYSTKGDKGTGLGLLVVDRIVRNHKGKIEILTKPMTGSLFRTIFRIE